MADDPTREVATRDGRRLACLEGGNPIGPLVIHNHGGPSSRLEARLLEASAVKNGTLALRFTPGFRLMYATLGFTAKHFRNSFVKQVRHGVNDYDQEVLDRPEIAAGFGDSCAEYFTHGSEGLVRDAELLYRAWAFDVSAIERPVHTWQGTDDRLIPEPINKMVADRMPGSGWHSVAGAGYFVAIGAGDDIFAIAAEKLGAP